MKKGTKSTIAVIAGAAIFFNMANEIWHHDISAALGWALAFILYIIQADNDE